MSCDPYKVVRDFEAALCDFTGAKYAVTTTSCTMAILLSLAYWRSKTPNQVSVTVPRRTYISVPMSVRHAGFKVHFTDHEWVGEYRMDPFNVWDCARWFRKRMYRPSSMMNISMHWTKQLAVGQGGAILHDNDEADEWLRRARFDGRKEGTAPKDDTFTMLGYHCYLSPRDAAEGISRLAVLPKAAGPLPNDDYPDLSLLEIFR